MLIREMVLLLSHSLRITLFDYFEYINENDIKLRHTTGFYFYLLLDFSAAICNKGMLSEKIDGCVEIGLFICENIHLKVRCVIEKSLL